MWLHHSRGGLIRIQLQVYPSRSVSFSCTNLFRTKQWVVCFTYTVGPAVAPTHGSKGGVSHKIQQLLNTLKRPKKNRRPIEEYYQDEGGASEYYVQLYYTSLYFPHAIYM